MIGDIQKILNKINTNKNPLKLFCKDIIEGVVAHKNLVVEDESSDTFPLLEGKSIDRY